MRNFNVVLESKSGEFSSPNNNLLRNLIQSACLLSANESISYKYVITGEYSYMEDDLYPTRNQQIERTCVEIFRNSESHHQCMNFIQHHHITVQVREGKV